MSQVSCDRLRGGRSEGMHQMRRLSFVEVKWLVWLVRCLAGVSTLRQMRYLWLALVTDVRKPVNRLVARK